MSAVEDYLCPAGVCCRCGKHAAERLMVALGQANSGPGWSKEACLPCARIYARSPFAPSWLRADLAAIDVARTLRVMR